MEKVLQMIGITKRFPGVLANDNINFDLEQGEIHALLGENGAGKTTLMNILFGLYGYDKGRIYIQGKEKAIRSPNDAITLGIGMVHQHFKLVPTLSVVESIILGMEITKGPFLMKKEATQKIEEIINEFRIEVPLHKKIVDLSVGERQRVEILKVLYRRADILILDEPTAVLTPPEINMLFESLKAMVERGKSIVIITHKLKEIMENTDRVTVLRRGKFIDTVNTANITTQQLAQMMIGRDVLLQVALENRQTRENDSEMNISLQNINVLGNNHLLAVKDFSLDIHKGEILCIAGVDGNGQSELAEALAGIRPFHSGNFLIDRQELTKMDVKKRLEAGVWYIPSDRNNRGAAIDLDVSTNVVLKHHRWEPYSKYGILNKRSINKFSCQLVEDFDVRCASVNDKAGTLSGGNLQKIIIGRETISKPKFLIAEQPTRGLDVSGIEFVRKLLLKQRKEGTSILLISADLDEVLALADSIVVLYEGKTVYKCVREEVDMDKLGLAMSGIPQ